MGSGVWLRCFPEDHERDSKVSSEICGLVSQSTRLHALRQGSDTAALPRRRCQLGQHGPQQKVRFTVKMQARPRILIFILFYFANTLRPFGCLVAGGSRVDER